MAASDGETWTQAEVRGLFLSNASAPNRQFELAKSFRFGTAGLGASECLARYFYKKVTDNPASQRPESQGYAVRAKAELTALRQRNQPCSLVLHTETPHATLDKLVELRGQPGESRRVFLSLTR